MFHLTTRCFRASLAVVLCLSMASLCHATRFYVRQNGNDNNSGTSRFQAFRTITKAASVAGRGDWIFVGAGNYDDESAFLNGNTHGGGDNGDLDEDSGRSGPRATSGWTLIYGDRFGRYTGDRGAVVIRSKNNRWGIRAANLGNLLVYGLSFEAAPGNKRSYGIAQYASSGTAIYYSCQFEDLQHGIRTRGDQTVYTYLCSFTGNVYGTYSNGAATSYVAYSRFAATRYGVVSVDAERTQVVGCTYVDQHPRTSKQPNTRGIHAVRSALTVNNCRFARSRIGIYGKDLTAGQITRCQFTEPKAHAVDCDGQSLAISDSQISDGRFGVTLGDETGQSAKLSNVTITGMRVGVQAHEGDLDFENVTISDSTYGIYQRSGNRQLTIDQSDDVTLTNNDYAIITNHRNNERGARLIVKDADLRGNKRGIHSRRTNVELEDCDFGGQKYGVVLADAVSANVTNCRFEGFPDAPGNCTYGIYVRSGDVNLRRNRTSHSRYGIYVHNMTDDAPVIKDNLCENASRSALFLRNGTWTYTGTDGNEFRDSPRGVTAHTVDWQIADVTTSNTCDYPILEYYGNCAIQNVKTTGKHTGLYAYRSQSLAIDGLEAADCGRTGVRVVQCDNVQLNNVVAMRNRNGIYVQENNDAVTPITNCVASGNSRYGILLSRTTLAPGVAANLSCTGNQFGLTVQDASLTLDPTMNVTVSGNRYGVLSRRGDLTMQAMNLTGNEVGVYMHTGAISVEQSQVSASNFGILAYPTTTASFADSQIRDSNYGVYVRARAPLTAPVTIDNVTFDQTTGHAAYLAGHESLTSEAQVTNSRFLNGKRGLTATRMSSLKARRLVFRNLSSIGLYQANGSGSITQSTFSNIASSWSVLAYGDRFDVAQSRVTSGKYGIGLLTDRGSVSNTVVDGTNYGIYLNKDGGRFSVLHATVANNRYIGLLKYHGNALVKNSIFQSSGFGLYDGKRGGAFQHTHNIVFAGRRPYTNTDPGEGELNKSPIFVDAAAGDLHLASGSPAINAGDDLYPLIAADIEGNARPSFRGFEIGAYEYLQPNGSLRVLSWDEVAK